MIRFIILCGGSGTRLWPLSNSELPKQFITLFGSMSLLQYTYQRLLYVLNAINTFGEISVVTNKKFSKIVEEQLPGIRQVLEPESRDTAASICAAVSMCNLNDLILICPADHYIPDQDEFTKSVSNGLTIAKNGHLVTFGLIPTYPETGYGYIEVESTSEIWAPVHNFREKPDMETAAKLIQQENFYWNSGILLFTGEIFTQEINKYQPEIYDTASLSVLSGGFFGSQYFLSNIFGTIPKISIDYGLLEKSNRVAMIKCNFVWSDVGNWKSIYDLLEKDTAGNISNNPDNRLVNSTQVYLSNSKPITIVGLSNIAVVETDNDILILNFNDSQSVKHIAK